MIIPEEPRQVHQEKPGQKASNIVQQTCLTHFWRLAGLPLLSSVAFLGQAVLVLESFSPLPLGLAVFVAALGSLHAVYNMTPFGSITLASKLNLPNVQKNPRLGCRNNALHGAVPDAIGFSRSWLTKLSLEYNELRGTLPDILGSLRGLFAIFVHKNHLSGALPASVGFLTVMDTLVVQENRMEGAIPDALELLRGLLIMFLSHNAISGSIPKAFSRWGQLALFCAGHNCLEGSIPSCLLGLGERNRAPPCSP